MEKIPAHEWFHKFATKNQSILEVPPIGQSSRRGLEGVSSRKAPPPVKHFYAQSFARSGLLKSDHLHATVSFIASIRNTTTSSYILSSIHLSKPNILVDFSVDPEAWRQLLFAVQGTLTEIYLDSVKVMTPAQSLANHSPLPIPIPLPYLKRFKVERAKVRLTRSLVDNLVQCPELEYVSFELDIEHESEECLSALNRLTAKIDIQFWVWLRRGHADKVFDGSAGFKGVALVSDKVKNFALCIDCWDRRLPSALANVVARCKNLQKLSIKKLDLCKDERGNDRNVESELAPLFSDKERASKLRELNWTGECRDGILRLIFENCLQLDSLAISDCPQLRHEYFVAWNARSTKPQSPKYICDGSGNVTSVTSSSCVGHASGASSRPVILSEREPLEECESCAGLLFMELLPRPSVQTRSDKRFCCCFW